MVAAVDALEECCCRGDRKRDFDHALSELARRLEPRGGEDVEHRPVVGKHLGHKASDPVLGRKRRQALEHAGADAVSLQFVGDGERGLGRVRVPQPDIEGDRDDLPVELPEQRTTLDPVRLETRLDQPRTDFR